MASGAKRSSSRQSPTQSRAARRVRRTRRRRFLRWGGATAVGTIAFVFILSLFIPNLPLHSLVGRDTPDGPGIRMDDHEVHFEDNLIDEDPHFVDMAAENFQLADDSPAYKLGFERIPMELIGLVQDEYRSGL